MQTTRKQSHTLSSYFLLLFEKWKELVHIAPCSIYRCMLHTCHVFFLHLDTISVGVGLWGACLQSTNEYLWPQQLGECSDRLLLEAFRSWCGGNPKNHRCTLKVFHPWSWWKFDWLVVGRDRHGLYMDRWWEWWCVMLLSSPRSKYPNSRVFKFFQNYKKWSWILMVFS